MNFRLRILLIICFGTFFRVNSYSQAEDAKVYFLGIGIEKCSNGTPGKPNAVADVQMVMKRTQKDAASGDVNFQHNGSSVMISKAVTFTLFNDDATIENIDSIVNKVIRPAARPHDVFYIYISAQSTGLAGGFTIPAKPAQVKKGKTAPPQRVILESSHLKELCEILACQNQLIVADAVSWQENHGTLLEQLLVPITQQKNQIILAPWGECTDSFLVAGKYVSCFAGSIYNAGQPLLRLLIKNNAITTKVKTSLNNAYNALTGSDDPVAEVYESWKLLGSSVAMKPVTPELKQEEIKAADPKTRGIDEDPSAEEEQAMIAAEEVTNFALIIANQNYLHWSRLFTPINDANELDKELREHYGYETKVLVNVTLDSLNKEFKALAARKFDSRSQVMIYYAGHGGYDEDLGEGYIVPVDASDPHSPSIMSDVISYGYLLKVLDNLGAQHVLVLLDACYSGAFNPQISGKKACPRRSSQAMQSLTLMVNNSMATRSRCYITSGMLNTVPDGTFHTPFNDAIVGTLRGKWDQGEVVFFEDLIVAVKKLPSKPQDGVFGQNADGDTGEYFFFPSKLLSKNKALKGK